MNNTNNPLISIIIPVYNGSSSIENVVHTSIEKFKRFHQIEIILINDCSTDNTDQVCQKLQQDNVETITYLSLAKNFGEHNAVMAGLNYSIGDYVVIIDDDGQNPPEEALKLINYIMESEYDVVYSKYQKKNHNFFRNIGSWLNGKIANLILEKPPNLYLSSFKAISRFTVNEITKYELSYPYIDGLIFRSTSNIGTLQTKHLPRSSGKSGYNLIKLMRIWLNMFTNFSVLPLRLASFTGFLLASTGISLGIFTIYERILDPYLPVGWASLLVVVSILGGVQLIALGLIGEYLGRVFLGLNKQPQFVIRETRMKKFKKSSAQ